MPTICAVYGCPSSTINKTTTLQGVKFYSFSGRPWQAERMAKWIHFCNRANIDGTEWKPVKNSRICSLHFVGGSKSEHPLHPAYNPTLYPAPPPKASILMTPESRFQRAQDRMTNRSSTTHRKISSTATRKDAELILPDDISQLPQSEPCALCIKQGPGIVRGECSFKETLTNMFHVMQISVTSLDELWSIAPESSNLSFCRECELLVRHGLYLKKQLLAIQSDVLSHSLGWHPLLDERIDAEESQNLLAAKKLRSKIRNLVVGCEVKLTEEKTSLTSTDGNEDDESNTQEPMDEADSDPIPPTAEEEEQGPFASGTDYQNVPENTIPATTLPYLPDPAVQPPPEKRSRSGTVELIERTVTPLNLGDTTTNLPSRRSAALAGSVHLGISIRSLYNRHTCSSCRTACLSEAILNLHQEEEHGSSEDVKLIYKCEFCDGELNAFMFLNQDAIPSRRYSTTIDGKMKYFAQFFRLCEAHHTKCLKEKQRDSATTHAAITGDSPFVKCKQIDFVGRSEPTVACLLCQSLYSIESSSMIQHYKLSHGLNFRFEDRFSCTGCFTPYKSSQAGFGIGKVSPDDVEHFKEFCKQHLLCNQKKHPAKSYVCKLCPKFQVFRTATGLFAHDIKVHAHDEKFSCPVCSSRFLYFEDFRNHAKKDHGAAVRSYCAVCSDSFQQRIDYLEHVTSIHRKKDSIYVCFVCGRELKTIPTLRIHMQNDHGQGKLKMPGYNKARTPRERAREAIKREKRIRNVDRIRPTRYFNCFLCDHSLQTAQLLDLHLREIHDPVPGVLSFKCVCGEGFKQAEFLVEENVKHPEYKYPPAINLSGKEIPVRTFSEHCNSHVLLCPTWLETKDQPEASSKLKCSRCKKISNSPAAYITHLQSHYGDILKKCYFCDFSINDSKKMDSHIYRIHYLKKSCNQQYYCRFCRECYAPQAAELETGRLVMEELDNFKKFGRLHATCEKTRPEPKTSFKCKFCDKILPNPFDLFKHEIKEHTKNFVAFCDQCGAGYASQSGLKTHVKTHQEKHLRCERCPAAFFKQSELLNHYRVHNDERPFVCDKCGKGFHNKDKLRVHMQRHREIADLPCTICGKMFRSTPVLRCHLYSVHNIRKKKRLPGS